MAVFHDIFKSSQSTEAFEDFSLEETLYVAEKFKNNFLSSKEDHLLRVEHFFLYYLKIEFFCDANLKKGKNGDFF
jgi:hypothetical protein